MRVFAIGDIHGCIEPFEKLLKKINLSKEDKLILLGDYIDRGKNSKLVLDKILELIDKGHNIVPLTGNHEKMMLNAKSSALYRHEWILNGGSTSIKSFNCENIEAIPDEYFKFISELYYFHEHDNYLFVHAGFSEETLSPFEDRDSMLWIRKEEYNSDFFANKFIVHGHTPTPLSSLKNTIKSNNRVINLDTGCVYNQQAQLGYLSAYCINNSELFYIKNNMIQ